MDYKNIIEDLKSKNVNITKLQIAYELTSLNKFANLSDVVLEQYTDLIYNAYIDSIYYSAFDIVCAFVKYVNKGYDIKKFDVEVANNMDY